MTWFENIGRFFTDNSSAITAWLTPPTIAAIIVSIVMAIRNGRAVKNSINVGQALSDDAAKIVGVSTAVNGVTEAIKNSNDKYWDLDAKIKSVYGKTESLQEDINNKFDELQDKLVAILEVQSLVYGTIQDDQLRTNVQNLIATAKLSSDHTRAKLQAEIDGLKEEVATKINAVSEAVADGVKQIEEASKATTAKKNNKVSRY